ncbi:hypothetical protein CHS0354_000873 [Potamilus streckersoni]|uniref:Uncharacterized protein n=1 Tax=Potamilus streckersoni TaxID=2493646 RepID=A0AAE0SI17_9BIVA|nr:hypothetical protein CHS0354_000873 [Potamilus streckersoni]
MKMHKFLLLGIQSVGQTMNVVIIRAKNISGAILTTATIGIFAALENAGGIKMLLTCGVNQETDGHIVEVIIYMISKGDNVLQHFHVDCTKKSPENLRNFIGATSIWLIIGTTVVYHGTYA